MREAARPVLQAREPSPPPPIRQVIEPPVPEYPANAFSVFLYKRGKDVISANAQISKIAFDE